VELAGRAIKPILIVAVAVLLCLGGAGDAAAEFGSDGLQKEVELSKRFAPMLSLLKQCNRSDLARRFIDLQDEFLAVCSATAEQTRRIKQPIQTAYQFKDCSALNEAVHAMESTVKDREKYVSDLKALKQMTSGSFTCD